MNNLAFSFNWNNKTVFFNNLTLEQVNILTEMLEALVNVTIRKNNPSQLNG